MTEPIEQASVPMIGVPKATMDALMGYLQKRPFEEVDALFTQVRAEAVPFTIVPEAQPKPQESKATPPVEEKQ